MNGARMNTYIALLRGINVGGNRVLPMKELVAILEDAGACRVRTYIQSGNAVFQSADADPARLASVLAAAIDRRRGFEPGILILEPEAMRKAMAEMPFAEAESDPASVHLGFLSAKPGKPDLEQLAGLRKESERFHLTDGVFYLHAPEGVGHSKLAANAEKLLGVPMTDRNWRTVCKIHEMVAAPSA
jgi:uncharacterized protein (DUF1697 family)